MTVKELKTTEMHEVSGGSIASPLINAVTKAITSIYDLGRETGSALRRLINGKYCPLR